MPPEPLAAQPPFHVDGCLFGREHIFISHSKVIIRGLAISFGSQDDPENAMHSWPPSPPPPFLAYFKS